MRGTLAILLLALFSSAAAWAAEPEPLRLEAKIALGAVRGRIDHMALDSARRRLFVAELGNDSVGVVDLEKGRVLSTLAGMKEPQGIGYDERRDMLYVANGGDGSLRLFRGADLAPAGSIDLGEDADNVRVDAAAGRVFVGYGRGALALIDAASRAKIGDIALAAHPESFQIASGGKAIFVNLPDAQAIAVVDRGSATVAASWRMAEARANFPMALDEAGGTVIVAFRHPPRLAAFAMKSGALAAESELCGDADDLFLDAARRRIYASCGAGFVDVLAAERGSFRRIARIPTVPGARTAFFDAERGVLYLGVRAQGAEPAAIWVYGTKP